MRQLAGFALPGGSSVSGSFLTAALAASFAAALLLAAGPVVAPATAKSVSSKRIVVPPIGKVVAVKRKPLQVAATTAKLKSAAVKAVLRPAAKSVSALPARPVKLGKVKAAILTRVPQNAASKLAVASVLKQSRPLVAFAPRAALQPIAHAAMKPKSVLAVLHPIALVKPIRTALLVPAIKLPDALTPDVRAELEFDPNPLEFMPEGPARRFTAAYAHFVFAAAVSFQPDVTAVCLPARLKMILNEIAEQYGPVTVASGWRDPEHNQAVGGALRSEHLNCLAVDFLAEGDHKAILDFLIANTDVGGYKLYRDGHFHIDLGPRRTW